MGANSETVERYENTDYDIIDFEGFDNETGLDYNIIPNIVHLLYLNTTNVSFYQAVNIYSIFLNQNPDKIYMHCDNCSFHGHYWNQINSIIELKRKLVIHKIPFHDTIFGQKYGWVHHHRSDVWRLMILMNYGGIYLDNDVYVVNNLDKYRKYEIAVSWDSDEDGIGVQTLIAHRNARFLKAHFDKYRTNYTASIWYYNAGYAPAHILLTQRNLAHAVKIKFGTHNLVTELYKQYWPEWKNLDTIHLLINHRHYQDAQSPIKEFNETNIQNYQYTYGEMCRTILQRIKPYL